MPSQVQNSAACSFASYTELVKTLLGLYVKGKHAYTWILSLESGPIPNIPPCALANILKPLVPNISVKADSAFIGDIIGNF